MAPTINRCYKVNHNGFSKDVFIIDHNRSDTGIIIESQSIALITAPAINLHFSPVIHGLGIFNESPSWETVEKITTLATHFTILGVAATLSIKFGGLWIQSQFR